MKEALWGYLILVLGVVVIIVMLVSQNYSVTDEENYYLVKETMEASMLESVDYGVYRRDGVIRIIEAKFVENFTRRFAQSIKGAKTYKIEFYEIYECPPKATIRISTSTGKYTVSSSTSDFDIVTLLSGIIEEKTKAGVIESN
ncbi:MAG: DUF5411 family protein [Bacilli bacterium]